MCLHEAKDQLNSRICFKRYQTDVYPLFYGPKRECVSFGECMRGFVCTCAEINVCVCVYVCVCERVK